MGLFSGFEKLGLGNFENAEIIEKNVVKSDAQQAVVVKTPEEKEREAIFDKHYTCPVRDLSFSSKMIRTGKIKLAAKDTDLRPFYEDVDPHKYDVVCCDKCGYSALTRYYGKLSMRQIKEIHDKIGVTFKGLNTDKELYSYDDAIVRYKLALVNCIVKGAKNGERAYTSLKLAWVLRGKRESLDKDKAIEEIKQLYKDELECLQNAYDGFVAAMANESFPIAGLDENTLMYLVAELARRLGKYEESARLLGRVITSRTTPERLKEQALVIKELLKKDCMKH